MLTLSGISKAFGGRVLFADVTLQLNRQDRLGLVGPNGAGKTTLFSIILGTEPADDGRIIKERDASLGYLPQESAPVGDETVIEIATAVTPEFPRLRRIIKAWEADHPIESLHPEEVHDDVHDRYNELNGYQVEAKAKQILAGLSFRETDFDRPAREMSGGWVMRAHLARLLTQEPDVLMLDEPTNHLDLESLLWFQSYLQNYSGALLVISHDREFLNALVTGIVEIRQCKLMRYTGNFDKYLVQREASEAQLLAAYKNQQKEIAGLMEFVTRFKAKASKAAQAQSKLKQVERMDKLEAPVSDDKKVSFSFPQPQRSGQKVVWLEAVHFAYGPNVVYQGAELEVQRGERIVLVGPNGAGKSTLLKLLAEKVIPQSGERGLGHNVTAGYYSQYRVDMMKPGRTVLAEALDTPARVTEQFVRTLLGSFLFSGDDVFKKIEMLSGGEKSRLALVKLLLDPPNLLLMDEPTTHLDMSSIDALLGALLQFEGTLVFISHDVYFIKALANKVIHVNAGRLTHYAGDYEHYLYKTNSLSARAALTAGGSGAAPTMKSTAKQSGAVPASDKRGLQRLDKQARQARANQLRSHKQLVARLEQDIHSLETRQAELTRELEKPDTYQVGGQAVELNREFKQNAERLATLTSDWEAAATKLEEFEAVR